MAVVGTEGEERREAEAGAGLGKDRVRGRFRLRRKGVEEAEVPLDLLSLRRPHQLPLLLRMEETRDPFQLSQTVTRDCKHPRRNSGWELLSMD